MPRPETVTDADIARWNGELRTLAQLADNSIGERLMFQMCLENPSLAESVYYTGAWLAEQLIALGCSPERKRDICFAHGQNLFGNPDPWGAAEHVLSEYQQGRWEEPGEGLAARVFERTFPTIAKQRREAESAP